MKKKALLFTILTLTGIVVLQPLASADAGSCRGDQQLQIDGNRLFAEIAKDEKTRRYGLMFRRKMEQDCAMLFVFSSDLIRSFTMRNTLIPLDIALIDRDGFIRETFTMQPGVSHYPSKAVTRYALQTNAGWFGRNSIEIGAKVQLASGKSPTELETLQAK